MAKSDARFEYKAQLGRQDHDLSQRLGLTSACGMLLPVWFDFASPGDSYYMNHDLPLLRSAVLAQPSMIDVKVHYETFFVPMQIIYQPFEQTMFSLKDLQSSQFTLSRLYNNVFPVFDYDTYVSDVKTSFNTQDIHADAFRMADLMGLCPDAFTTASLQSTYKPSFFPWQICAYHAIYEYYYRLDDKSNFYNIFFNWDQHYDDNTPIQMNKGFMQIYQRPWDFDYFTSIYRSPIVSDANLQSVLPSKIYSDLMTNYTRPLQRTGIGAAVNSDTKSFASFQFNNPSQTDQQLSLNTAMIRQMFANEKLAMITGRTRKNYDSQVLAHYGVPVPHDIKHDITMIHHDIYELNVQEVTSLAATSSDPLGELAGKSYAAGQGKEFKFTAPVHGVMMTILSIEPKKRYFGTFDRLNAVVSAFDFPTPEFDRLGNQPMFRYESGFAPTPGDTRDNSDIIGWKERYYANKRKYDKTTYAFGYGNQFAYTNNWAAYMLAFRPFATYWDNNNAPDQRPDLESRFYIERNALDACCLTRFAYGWKADAQGEDWSNTPWLVYQRDPFIINSFIKCKKVSWMSKDGEPIYNY